MVCQVSLLWFIATNTAIFINYTLLYSLESEKSKGKVYRGIGGGNQL